MRLLLTWSDRGVAAAPAHRAQRRSADPGPVLRFLEQEEARGAYDKALILAAGAGLGPVRELEREMGTSVTAVEVRSLEVTDPSDYAVLFRELAPVVEEVRRDYAEAGWKIDVLLSAGTPQAQTLWVVLVQAGLLRARMLQVIPPEFVPIPHLRPIREVRLDIEGFPQMRVLRDEVVRLRAELRSHRSRLIGGSEPMRRLLERVARVAPSGLPVLILGETGTGKELVARTLHEGGPRALGPFVSENCGAIAEGVLASELFGHEAGAFTGATHRRRGLFEQAHGGTLLLDEVGELPPHVQAMLLRVLQEGVIRRVGGERWTRVDVRVLAATHRDLRQLVREGRFREDLYYRLHGTSLVVPPLRARTGDIPLLIEAFSREVGPRRRRPLEVTRAAMRRLVEYPWPGNVRELRSEVQRWSVFSDGAVDVDDLSEELRAPVEAGIGSAAGHPSPADDTRTLESLSESVQRAERAAVERALEAHHGNLARAARSLEIERNTLKRKLHAFGMYPPPGRSRG